MNETSSDFPHFSSINFKQYFCLLRLWYIFYTFVCNSLQFALFLGLIGYILSWHMWTPLGKLTFGAYLAHGIWLAVYTYSQQQPVVMSSMTLVSICYHNHSPLSTSFCYQHKFLNMKNYGFRL